MIARHEDEFLGRLMCRVLAVSVSGYDAYRRRPESWRAVIDDVLLAHVRIPSRRIAGVHTRRPRIGLHWRRTACWRA